MCFAPRRRALFRHLNFQKWSVHGVFCTFWLRNVLRATTACTFSTSQLPKVVRTWCVLYILTSKCASRHKHKGVHFFDISTSKSGPTMVCFVHFDLEMCFAPQRRALFRHRNFQKWSGAEVFCTFWLGHVLRAATACNFSSLIWPAGSAPAALASLLFDPPEPQIIEKTQCFATFLPFRASASAFFWLFLFYSSSSDLSLLSASSLLCFSSVHIVGSLTSKLPSNSYLYGYFYGHITPLNKVIYIYYNIYNIYIYIYHYKPIKTTVSWANFSLRSKFFTGDHGDRQQVGEVTIWWSKPRMTRLFSTGEWSPKKRILDPTRRTNWLVGLSFMSQNLPYPKLDLY